LLGDVALTVPLRCDARAENASEEGWLESHLLRPGSVFRFVLALSEAHLNGARKTATLM
jgi:hypothetical protein